MLEPNQGSNKTASASHKQAASDHEACAKHHHEAANMHDNDKADEAKMSSRAAMDCCDKATKQSTTACGCSAN